MCGISAWITIDRVSRRNFERYNGIVRHRGPDDSGYYYDETDSVSIALGHQRLSIIDLSRAGHQPMQSSEYVIVFNGEIYNYIEIREELQLRGVDFFSHSDTEVLLKAFIEWGKTCLEKLNGMFAFVIYDKTNKQLFAARDRFGIKPLYYMRNTSQDSVYFASEIKQFTTLNSFRPIGNLETIRDFILNRHIDYSASTLYHGVYQLQGGECCTIDLTKMSFVTERWYDLEERISDDHKSDPDDFYSLFVDSVKLRMRSDVEVGSCLSGGIDSSSIVCIVDNIVGTKKTPSLKTFTSSLEDKQLDESKYVELIARDRDICCNYVFPSFDVFVDDIEQLIYYQDGPILSSSIFAQREVFRTAHNHNIKVMLDGQGSDEILAGYTTIFYPCYIMGLLRTIKIADLLVEGATAQSKRLLVRSLLSSFTRARSQHQKAKHVFRTAISTSEAEQDRVFFSVKDCSVYLMRFHLPALLHCDDRNSMNYSVESRLPFLDYRLVEFALGLSDREKIGRQISKKILRKQMRGIVPDGILTRRNKWGGFATPQKQWIRNNLNIFLDSLAGLRKIDLFEESYLDSFLEGAVNNTLDFSQLMRLYTFAIWLKVFNIGRFNA